MNKPARIKICIKKSLLRRGVGCGLMALGLFLSACESPLLPMPWQGRGAEAAPRATSPAKKLPKAPAQVPSSQTVARTQPAPVQAEPVRPAVPERGWPPTFGDAAQPQAPVAASPDIAAAVPARPGLTPQDPAQPTFAPLINRPLSPEGPFPNAAPPGAAAPERSLQLPPPPMKTSSVRVALLLPLSGANAQIGQAMLNAAQLALFSFSEKTFELLVHDTKGTPEGAADAAQLAIGDGARLILGPLLSASVRAITPAARAANVPVVAFSSDKAIAGDGTFTLGFIPSAEVWRVVRFARSRGVVRFAALAPETAYGRTVIDAFRQAVEQNGAVVARIEFYDPHAEDYGPLIRDFADYENRRAALLAQREELKARDDELAKRALERLEKLQTVGPLPFDALFLADGGKRLQAIAALLPFYDIDPAKVRMLGTGQWDEPGIGREPALIGGWYAAPPPDSRANFETQYRQMYGARPPRLATLAYDATALATVLARGASENAEGVAGGPDFSFKALTTPSGFAGRDGIFRLLPDGLPERGLSVLQVGPRQNKVISPAPDSFSQQAAN